MNKTQPASPPKHPGLSRFLGILSSSALAVVLALAVGAIFILISNDNPIVAYRALINGAFGGRRAVAETLVASTPLILGGLAFAVAARAGLFNIGIEGQLVMGSLAGALVGAADLGLPPVIYVPLAIFVGGVVGGIWGAIAGLLKARSGASEVITTIMLNYLAFRISSYMLTAAGSWLSLIDTMQQATKKVVPDARLPIILKGTRLHAGLIFALVAAVVLWYVLFRTTFGYKIRTVGLSQGAAAYAGINWGRTIILAMFVSGFLGGMAGAIEATGLLGRHYDNRAGYGFTAIAVGLVGRNNPLGVIVAGLLFGVLRSGSNGMQNQAGTSKELVLILQGLVILSMAALAAFELKRDIRKQRSETAAPTPPPALTEPAPQGAQV